MKIRRYTYHKFIVEEENRSVMITMEREGKHTFTKPAVQSQISPSAQKSYDPGTL